MDPVIDDDQDWVVKRESIEDAVNIGNVVRRWQWRERGFDPPHGSSNKTVLENIAEDILVKKRLKNQRCDLPGYPRSTFLMVFSPDGTKVASTHGNHNIYVSELASGKHVCILKGHPRTPWCIAFHPSHPQLIGSGCLGGQVRVWDSTGGSETWTVETETVISSLAFHPRDKLLVIATFSELYFWNWSQPAPFTRVSTNNFNEKVKYVAFDSLGFKLITGIICSESVNTNTAFQDNIPNNRNGGDNGNNGDGGPDDRGGRPDNDRENIVNSYQHLVHRYDILVRNYQRLFMARHQLISRRNPSTIDRGTDPMETDANNAGASTSNTDRGGEGAPFNPENDIFEDEDIFLLPDFERVAGGAAGDHLQEERPSLPSQSSAFQRFAELERRVLLAVNSGDRTNINNAIQDLNPNRGSSRTNIFVSPRPNTPQGQFLFQRRPLTDELRSRILNFPRTHEETQRAPVPSSENPDPSPSIAPSPGNSLFVRDSYSSLLRRNPRFFSALAQSRSMASRLSTASPRRSPGPSSRRLPSFSRRTPGSSDVPRSSRQRVGPPSGRIRNSSSNASGGLNTDYLDESTGLLLDETLDRPTEPVAGSMRTPSLDDDDLGSITIPPLDSDGNVNEEAIAEQIRQQARLVNEGWDEHIIDDLTTGISAFIRDYHQSRESRRRAQANSSSSQPGTGNSAMGISESNSDSDESREVIIYGNRQGLILDPLRDPIRNSRRSNRVVIDLNPTPGQNRQDRFQFTRRPVEGTLRTFLTRLYKGRFRGNDSAPTNNESNVDLNGNNEASSSSSSNSSNNVNNNSNNVNNNNSNNVNNNSNNVNNNNSDESGLSDASAPSPSQPDPNINEPSTSSGPGTTDSSNNTNTDSMMTKIYAAIRALNKHTRILSLMLQIGRQTTLPELLSMWDDLRRRVLAIETDSIAPPELSNNRNDAERLRLVTDLSRNIVNDMPNLPAQRVPSTPENSDNNNASASTPTNVDNNVEPESLPSTSTQEPQPSTSRLSAQENQNRMAKAKYVMLRKKLTFAARMRLSGEVRRQNNNRRPQRQTLTAAEIRSSRSQIRLHAMQVLSMLFYLMIECLEKRGLTDVIIKMLQTLKRALRITSLLLSAAAPRNAPINVAENNPTQMDHNYAPYVPRPSTSADTSNRPTPINSTPTNSAPTNITPTNVARPTTTNTGGNNTKRKVSTKQNSSQTCNIINPSSEATSSVIQRDIEPPWSNRLAVQISAANRNNSSTARNRREQYIESRREKALHKCNPAAHPISRRKLLPPTGSNRIPSIRRLPSRPRAPRPPRPRNQGVLDLASMANINFSEPGPSSLFIPSTSGIAHDSQEVNVDGLPDSSSRNELYRIAQLNATRARNAARERLRRLQAIRFFSSLRDPEFEEYSGIFDDPNAPQRPRRHRPILVHRTEQLESVLSQIGVPIVQVNGLDSINDDQANHPPIIARVQPIILAQNFVIDDNGQVSGGSPGILDSSFMPEMLPVHRVQAWDFTTGSPPDIGNRTKNLVVQRCRIHNDASIDISKDGRLLVALLPVPRLRNSIHRLGVYSLEWGTLGQCLHTASLEQSAVSVALSPTSRYLAVGLGSRRFTYLPHPRNNVFALIYKLSPPENAKGAAITAIKELEQNWEQQFTSLNCLRWAPQPGQGLVYANNTGQLILMS